MSVAWKCRIWTLVALAACATSWFLHYRAWHLGYEASLQGLYQCSFSCGPVLFFSWAAILAPFAPPVELEEGERSTWAAIWSVGILLCALACCVSVHFLWIAVAVVLAVIHLGLVGFARVRRPPIWKTLALHTALTSGLFMLTWDRCSTTTERFLDGFGHRIDDTCGAERLMAWAKEVIAQQPQGRTLVRNDYPDFILELMDGPPPWPNGWVAGPAGEHATVVIANGSGYGFGITIRPSGSENGPGTGGTYRMTWRPGLFLHTVSK